MTAARVPEAGGLGGQERTEVDWADLRPARPVMRRPSRRTWWKRLGRPLTGLVILSLIAAAADVLVKLGDGFFAPVYSVSAYFPTASAGLHAGSEVDERGVEIGTVRSISLHGRQASVTLSIDDKYRIPTDATATIAPENVFGADRVLVSAPTSGRRGTSYLTNGGLIAHTTVLGELGQLFATADPLLGKIDTADLSRVMGELASAYAGEGRQIAASFQTGTRLAALLSRTTWAQLKALDAFTRFNVAIEGEGPVLNRLGSDANSTLPLFNRAEAAYARLMAYMGSFSNEFAALLSDYRPDIDTILNQGGNVVRVLLAQRSDIASLVQGLAMYAYRFAHGDSAATLPDGSKFGYFKTFIVWGDIQHLICGLIAPAVPGLEYLEPLQKLLSGPSTPLQCSSQLAAFDKAQASTPSSQRPASPTSAKASSAAANTTKSLRQQANGAAQGLYGIASQPQSGGTTNLGSYVDSLLGGGSGP